MNEPFETELPCDPSTWQHPVPELAPPPRVVPMVIQWQLLQHRVLLIIGGAFVLVSLLVFIVPQFAAGNRFESPWQLFPFLHLAVGLGMVIVPLIAWRGRVAVLKRGQLAPARIVALQNQSSSRAPGEKSYGVRNVDGPWLAYETALAQAKRFWTTTLPAGPPESLNPASMILSGFGCVLMGFGLFAVVFTVAALAIIWLSNRPVGFADRGGESLLLLGFMAVYLGGVWFMRRWVEQTMRFASGELTMGASGVPSTVRCRFVFSIANGREIDATAYIDLRQRLERGQATPADLAVYLPDEPRHAVLLGGLWPPLAIRDGQWVRHPQAE